MALGAALVATPAAAVVGSHFSDTAIEAIVLAVASALTTALVLTRMGIVLRAHDRARVAQERARGAEEARGSSSPHPNDVASDADPFAELIAGARDSYTTEKRYIRKDGAVFWGRLTHSLARREDGEVMFAIAPVEDVTAVHQAERALADSEHRSI